MTNHGTVHANGSNELELNTAAKTSNGLMKASSGGTLDVYVNIDGTGRWEVDGPGSKIQLNNSVAVTTTGDKEKVSSSMSNSLISAPALWAAIAVAIKVLVGTRTALPLTSMALSATSKASVPEPTAIACLALMNLAN